MAAYGLLTSVGFATARDTMGFLEALLESLGAGLGHARGNSLNLDTALAM